jgi:hypothetical protein
LDQRPVFIECGRSYARQSPAKPFSYTALEHSQRSNHAHEKKIPGASTDAEENVRAALKQRLVGINDINRRSCPHFLNTLDRLRELMEEPGGVAMIPTRRNRLMKRRVDAAT